ncbi:RecQ-mediated genome instability protein 2 [Dioscorea alata]|uniref:RecQ-mediated genome instability protein 2 n=2 Tax=Dioscorea alata TaxID=55571 RepID=A0ACB7ULC1_DIOAL|nr:RecQ-mediated genome instability protein 2 [Dioscorea alata]
MDYSLAALKLFCGQLRSARQDNSTSSSANVLLGILFQRAWLQGVLISGSEEGRFLLDDGTGVVELSLSSEFQPQDWKIGLYVMVVGMYNALPVGGLPLIKVHKIVDLSACPDREAMWQLEVIEAYKFFYLPSVV